MINALLLVLSMIGLGAGSALLTQKVTYSLRTLEMFGCAIVPGLAMLLAILESGLRFDGTISLGNIVSTGIFIGGGVLLIGKIPKLEKDSIQHGLNIGQIANDMTKAATILDAVEKRVTKIEDRFNDHIDTH